VFLGQIFLLGRTDMKRTLLTLALLSIAVFIAACGAPAANTGVNNANTNTTKPVAAAPTADALLAMDKQANEAFIKGDAKYFDGFLSDKFVSFEMGQRMDRAEMLKMVASNKCDIKAWSLDDPQMAMINADTYVMSYKGTWDGTCTGPDGKAMKLPSPMRAASVYIRNGEKWQGAFHAENMIIDPKAPPAAPAKPEAKKEEAKKEGPMKDDKAASNSAAAPAKATADPNTEALVKLHTSGWEAFKAKDAKKFDEMLTANFSFVDPIGGYHGGKAAVIKQWTETMKCEGITKVGVSDGFASALSSTVEVLTLKGTADGTCDGQKNGPLNQAAIYVKEGDAWKLAFMFESAAM
jgi:ketosteroid isomerase-like protein